MQPSIEQQHLAMAVINGHFKLWATLTATNSLPGDFAAILVKTELKTGYRQSNE